jgi:hypothetical protein
MAATTFVASATYTSPSGGTATGNVEFQAVNTREVNTATIQDSIKQVATLAGGAIAQTLVVNVGGYNVTENIVGALPVSYVIPGLANINLSTVDASTANFDASSVVNVVPPEFVAGTTYTFVLSDGANVVKQFTAATAVTTIIDGAAVLPVGWTVSWMQQGAGTLAFTVINGAVLRAVGNVTHSQGQWSAGTLRKYAPTGYILAGEIG